MQNDCIVDTNDCDCDEDNNCGCSYPNNVNKSAYGYDENNSLCDNFNHKKQTPSTLGNDSICICDTHADCSCVKKK